MNAGAPGYNERLFSGGLRGRLHMARFLWAAREADALTHDRVLEVGCFDGRMLDHIRPAAYVGLDAGWEGGLAAARKRFAGDARITLIETVSPAALDDFGDRSFDLGLALETLEHVPPEVLPAYLDQLARLVDGHLLVSVPNEKGLVFLAKHLIKTLLLRDSSEVYSFREVVAATLGRMDRVARNEHKGFDYQVLIGQLAERFEILKVTGLPLGPPGLAFSVAILARARQSMSGEAGRGSPRGHAPDSRV